MISTKVKMAILAVAISSALGGLYAVYEYVKNIGYSKAQIECTEKFARYEEKIEKKIDKLETTLGELGVDLTANNQVLAADIETIIKQTKQKPVAVIKNGKCVPSQNFIDSLNQAADRVNSGAVKK